MIRVLAFVVMALASAPLLGAGAVTESETGLFTQEQAEQGADLYRQHCMACHGQELQSPTVPPLKGPAFAQVWGRGDRTLESLYYITFLYNRIESDLEELDYETATFNASYMILRNLRIMGEYTRDIEHETNTFTGGITAAF